MVLEHGIRKRRVPPEQNTHIITKNQSRVAHYSTRTFQNQERKFCFACLLPSFHKCTALFPSTSFVFQLLLYFSERIFTLKNTRENSLHLKTRTLFTIFWKHWFLPQISSIFSQRKFNFFLEKFSSFLLGFPQHFLTPVQQYFLRENFSVLLRKFLGIFDSEICKLSFEDFVLFFSSYHFFIENSQSPLFFAFRHSNNVHIAVFLLEFCFYAHFHTDFYCIFPQNEIFF